METKKLDINGKMVKLYKRECTKCDTIEWVKTSRPGVMCKSCQSIFKESIAIGKNLEELPQDEDKNREMIDKWLKENEPSVIDHKPMPQLSVSVLGRGGSIFG